MLKLGKRTVYKNCSSIFSFRIWCIKSYVARFCNLLMTKLMMWNVNIYDTYIDLLLTWTIIGCSSLFEKVRKKFKVILYCLEIFKLYLRSYSKKVTHSCIKMVEYKVLVRYRYYSVPVSVAKNTRQCSATSLYGIPQLEQNHRAILSR